MIAHESLLGRWDLTLRQPDRRLAPYISQFEGYVEYGASCVRRRELPFPGLPLIISFGSRYRVEDACTLATPSLGTFIAGLHTRAVFVESGEASFGMQVNLTPVGAYLFLGQPLHQLLNRSLELSEILGPEGDVLAQVLHGTADWPGRFALLDAYFLRRFAAARPLPPAIEWAWARLTKSGGTTPVARLAGETGFSTKHLCTQFGDYFGLSPKLAARVIRFDRAVKQLDRGPGTCLADIAAATGYFDQAHFNREFKEFAGLTPRAYLRNRLSDGTGLIES